MFIESYLIYFLFLVAFINIRALVFITLFSFFYGYNIEIDFVFNFRGILTILLFIRLLFEPLSFYYILKLFKNHSKEIFILLAFFMIGYLPYFISPGNNNFNPVVFVVLLIVFIIGYLLIKLELWNIVIKAFIFTTIVNFFDIFWSEFVYTGKSSDYVLNIKRSIFFYVNGLTKYVNHNYLGMCFSISIIYLSSGLIQNRRKHSFFTFLYLSLCFMGLILTTSRSSTIALLIVILSMLMIYKRYHLNKFNYLPFVITAGLVLFAFITFQDLLPQKYLTEFYQRIVYEPENLFSGDIKGSGNFLSRLMLFEGGLDLFFNKRGGIFGSGFQSWEYLRYNNYNLNFDALHNGYILILLETGFIGLLLLLFFLKNLLVLSYKRIEKDLEYLIPNFFFLFYLLIYCIVHNNEITSNYAFLFYGILLAESETLITRNQKIEKVIQN